MGHSLEENMKVAHFTHKASDGKSIYVRLWLPSGEPRAVILIAHGMAEHGARYERFAERLTAKGYAVYVPDDRGHGKTAATPAELGYFADKEGFRRVIDDDHEIAIAPYSRQIGPYAVLEELGRQPYVLNPLNDCRGV